VSRRAEVPEVNAHGAGRPDREVLALAVRAELRELAAALEHLDERVADELGLHRTDLRCLAAVARRGPLTASAVSEAVRLSSGGTSIALGRLEAAGMVRRYHAEGDRRQVLVELTPLARRRAAHSYGTVGAHVGALLETFDDGELRAVLAFLEGVRSVLCDRSAGTAGAGGRPARGQAGSLRQRPAGEVGRTSPSAPAYPASGQANLRARRRGTGDQARRPFRQGPP
jgi:DNA-binding MarR family transcriptional regulator